MLQISQLRLPVNHSEDDLHRAVAGLLGVKREKLEQVTIKQRAVDARKRGEVQFCYILHVKVKDEGKIIKKSTNLGRVERAPDESYTGPGAEAVAEATAAVTENASSKPSVVVVGAGPCVFFVLSCWLALALNHCCWNAVKRLAREQGM